MPYCPKCHGEFIRSMEICSTCDVPLVAELPQKAMIQTVEGALAYMKERTPVMIMRSTLEPCREVRDYLLDCDMPCLIEEAEEHTGTDVPSVAIRYDLVVAQEDLEQVKQLLQDVQYALFENEGVELHEADTVTLEEGAEATCPACGQTFIVAGDECPGCGLYLGMG